jgi:hypothetical protein
MVTFKNTLIVAIAALSLLIQTSALKAGVDFGCPKGFYCASKKRGGAWCTGHNECLSGECVTGVGCAMTTNEVNGSGGCNFDSDCSVGFKCHNDVCFMPDAQQAVDDTPQVVESTPQQQVQKKQNGLCAGAIAGIAIAAVLVVVIVAGWIAMRASTSKLLHSVMDVEEDQGKKDDDGVITEAGSVAGDNTLP